jgi:hypothetical protein
MRFREMETLLGGAATAYNCQAMRHPFSLVSVTMVGAVLVISSAGCSSKSSDDSSSGSSSKSGSSSGSGSMSGSGTSSASGSAPEGDAGASDATIIVQYTDGGGPAVGPSVGQIDGGVATKLPSLPPLTNVVGVLNDDSVSITFDPVDGALDYRVYPLPSDGDISVASDGHVVVHNGTYRCSGDRESPAPYIDSAAMVGGDAIHTQVNQQMVGGYLRTMADATLGYVYTQPGPGLVPVYALGDSDPNADTTCFYARWAASRAKKYTTSETERTQLLAALDRDDGIAFYVPAAAGATTRQIYFEEDQKGTASESRLYYGAGPEANAHSGKMPAFVVLTNSAPGAVPLMRVYYNNECGWSHDELAVGQERFNRIYKQGDGQPWWSLLWTGVTAPTTLVVEALDTGCPYQGFLAAQAVAGSTAMFGSMPIVHQPFITMDAARAASSTTEVFINGQHAATNQPKAVARSFLNVAPSPHPKMDFFAGFSPNDTPEKFVDVACGSPDKNCYQTWRQQSPTFDQMFISVESGPGADAGLYSSGPVLGELWLGYADKAGDTNGKYRLTANQKATMSSSSFLHVTMEVDAYTTARRYPQILISDQVAPVQYNLVNGHTVVIQPFGQIGESIDWPIDYQIEVCNLRTWDVNDQCPVYDLYHLTNGSSTATAHLAPNDEVGEHASVDHRVVFDAYASTQRIYLFLDGKPYACANMPSVGVPNGAVTVTWGDVLYHSLVDHTFAFHTAHMQVEQRRHFDNLGFSSGLPAPTWDESRLPCAAPITP